MKSGLFFIFMIISLNLFAQIDVSKVTIESEDQFKLSAQYYSSGKTGPGILLFHQCNRRGPLTGYEQLAEMLAKAGYNVLVPDGRGFGESRNEQYRDFHSQMSLIEPRVPQDIEAFYKFLSSRKAVDSTRIGLAGASCGARKAIRLAAAHPEIRTMVLISGAFNTAGPLAKTYQQRAEMPVLSIFSENDRYGTPAAMQFAFQSSKNENSKLLVYKGDKHGTPLFEQDRQLEQEVLAWYIAHLQSKN